MTLSRERIYFFFTLYDWKNFQVTPLRITSALIAAYFLHILSLISGALGCFPPPPPLCCFIQCRGSSNTDPSLRIPTILDLQYSPVFILYPPPFPQPIPLPSFIVEKKTLEIAAMRSESSAGCFFFLCKISTPPDSRGALHLNQDLAARIRDQSAPPTAPLPSSLPRWPAPQAPVIQG